MQIFLKNLDLRPSCYHCPAKCGKSNSDITIADFWGLDHDDIEIYDKNGVSLIMCHTGKGAKLIEAIKDIKLSEVEYQQAICNNMSFEKSVALPKSYHIFWRKFYESRFDSIPDILKKMRPSLGVRMKAKIKAKIPQSVKPFFKVGSKNR